MVELKAGHNVRRESARESSVDVPCFPRGWAVDLRRALCSVATTAQRVLLEAIGVRQLTFVVAS